QDWYFVGNRSDFSDVRPIPLPCWKSSAISVNTAFNNGWTHCTTGPTPPAVCAAATNSVQNPALALAALNAVGCYMSWNGRSVLIPPALGTDGNLSRNPFRGPNFRNLDLSIIKNTKIKEQINVQFRAEFFNVLNHPNFAAVDDG